MRSIIQDGSDDMPSPVFEGAIHIITGGILMMVKIKRNLRMAATILLSITLIAGCGNKPGEESVLPDLSIGSVSNEEAVGQATLIAEAFVKTLEDPEVIASGDFNPADYDGWRDMTAWDANKDSVLKTLAKNLGISDYSELTRQYKLNAKGFDGKVYVWIYNHTVFIVLSQTSRGDGMLMMPTAEEGYEPDPWDRTMAYDELYVTRDFDTKIIEEANGKSARQEPSGDEPDTDEDEPKDNDEDKPDDNDEDEPKNNNNDDKKRKTPDYDISEYDVIFSTFNIAGVNNGPTERTTFTVAEGSTYDIWSITTYHWNNGRGAEPGQIKLLRNGKVIGTWDAVGRSGSGKQNVNWDVVVHISIPEGEYEIVDSDPDTWSCNSESKNRGFVEIRGYELFELPEVY